MELCRTSSNRVVFSSPAARSFPSSKETEESSFKMAFQLQLKSLTSSMKPKGRRDPGQEGRARIPRSQPRGAWLSGTASRGAIYRKLYK